MFQMCTAPLFSAFNVIVMCVYFQSFSLITNVVFIKEEVFFILTIISLCSSFLAKSLRCRYLRSHSGRIIGA